MMHSVAFRKAKNHLMTATMFAATAAVAAEAVPPGKIGAAVIASAIDVNIAIEVLRNVLILLSTESPSIFLNCVNSLVRGSTA